MTESVAVNFKNTFPVFPLPETLLLPHAVLPVSVSEPRYLQLTDHALDGSGQIAVATYGNTKEKGDCEEPSLRSTVCLGQIVQHEKAHYGYNILVYGLCRATIANETQPTDECLYRKAKLLPFVGEESDELDLEEYRDELLHLMFRPGLQRVENHQTIMDWITEGGLSTPALFELIGCTVFNDSELRYELLSEPSCIARTKRVMKELIQLDKTLSMTDNQSQDRWENGISWN
ncbi:MAG: LON peptidase substrate-binding domain-containing protein [Phycisphaerales bacterium]|jgi:Lon protease-like protein|nr:LON peptidase substrate-binding domain-containing protein [Phycisphaerales bacterium]